MQKVYFFPFDEAKYEISNKSKKLYKLEIKPSTIPNAGEGVFTLTAIPKGVCASYKGKKLYPAQEDELHEQYSWEILSYDSKSGKQDDKSELLFLLDAYDKDAKNSNWARYVNCGSTEASNNMNAFQYFGNIYYCTTRDIAAGEELFVDYGETYRSGWLNIKYS